MSAFTPDDPLPAIEVDGAVDSETVRELLLEGAGAGSVLTLSNQDLPGPWVSAGQPVDTLESVPEDCIDGVLAVQGFTTVPVRPRMGQIARVLRIGGWLGLAQSDHTCTFAGLQLGGWTGRERRALDAALLAAFPHQRGAVVEELIWEARGQGLRPTRLHLGFAHRKVGAGDLDDYLREGPAAGIPGPLDRITAAAGVTLADRYAEAWQEATAAGPVTVSTPMVVLAARRVAGDPLAPVAGPARRLPLLAEPIRSPRPEAERAIMDALGRHRRRWDDLVAGTRSESRRERLGSA